MHVGSIATPFFKMNLPSLTTAKLDRASGTLTPAATNVRPITVSGIPSVLPAWNHKFLLIHFDRTRALVWCTKISFLTYDGDHPHHDIRVERYPYHGYNKCKWIPLAEPFCLTIWHGFSTQIVNWHHCSPSDFLVGCCIRRHFQGIYLNIVKSTNEIIS